MSGSIANASEDNVVGFEKALRIWEEINLADLQKALDGEALEIKENQKSLLLSRKDLAVKTKQFKKLGDQEKLLEIKPLLKAYQNEIDNLTKKEKFVETSFFKVYKDISEAPDPAPLLSSSLKSFKISSDIDGLRKENTQLQEKLDKWKDYESIKAKLIESEQKHAESLNIKLLLKEDEYKSKLDEVESKQKVSEMDYERKVANLAKQVSELKALNQIAKNKLRAQQKMLGNDDEDNDDEDNDDDNERTDKPETSSGSANGIESSSNGELPKDKSALKVELGLLTRDLQYTKSKAIELEKRNQELKHSLGLLQASNNTDDQVSKLKQRTETLEKTNSVLLQKSTTNQKLITKLTSELSEKANELKNKTASYSSKMSELKHKLHEYQDYDDIKNELQILRSMEFDDELDPDSAKDIDRGLMLKNRKLNNEVVKYRNKNAELQNQLKETTITVKKLEAQISQLKNINERIESDIANIKASNKNDNWEAMSMISGVSRFPPRSVVPSGRFSRHDSGKISPAASIAGYDETASTIGGAGGAGISAGTDSGLLPIITQQRDRFRAKNTELEVKIRDSTKTVTELKKQNSVLQRKVTNLATEVKFLQSKTLHRSQGKPAVSNPYGDQFASSTYDVLFDDYENFSFIVNSKPLQILEKYLGNDNTKKIDKKLNQIERYFYNFLKVILKNQATRTAFIGYWFVLHACFFLFIFKIFTGGFSKSAVLAVASGSIASSESNADAAKLIADAAGISRPEAAAAAAVAANQLRAPQAAVDAIKVD